MQTGGSWRGREGRGEGREEKRGEETRGKEGRIEEKRREERRGGESRIKENREEKRGEVGLGRGGTTEREHRKKREHWKKKRIEELASYTLIEKKWISHQSQWTVIYSHKKGLNRIRFKTTSSIWVIGITVLILISSPTVRFRAESGL